MIARHRLRLKSLSITGQVECATSPDETAEQTIEDKISAAAMEHRSRLDFDGKTFSGPAWDRVVAEGAAAQFFLVGEEQGIAENPKLVAQLFSELSNRGYSKLAIEISPTMAWNSNAARELPSVLARRKAARHGSESDGQVRCVPYRARS